MRTLLPKLLVTLPIVLLTTIGTANAEFSKRRLRYASSYDILSLLIKNFPGHGQDRAKSVSLACHSVTAANRDVLGGSSTISGQPLMEKPNPGFIRWLNQCLIQYAKFEFEPTDTVRESFLNDYFPLELQKSAGPVAAYLAKPWQSLSLNTQSRLIEHMIRKMIGPPEVYQSYSPNGNWTTLTSSIEKTAAAMTSPNATVGSALGTVAHTIFLRDEFQRY